MDKMMNNAESNFPGSGWSFPITFSAGNYQLNTSSFEANINECINIILQTKNGERSFNPGFGSGLQQFFFARMNETLKGRIIDAVKTSLLNNEPRIAVLAVDVEYSDMADGLIEISITYRYNSTNTRHNYVFPFHINEGANLVR